MPTFRLSSLPEGRQAVLLELDFTEQLVALRQEQKGVVRDREYTRIKLPSRYAGDVENEGPPLDKDETIIGPVAETIGSDVVVVNQVFQDGIIRRALPWRRIRKGVSPRLVGDVLEELYRNAAYDDYVHAIGVHTGRYPSGARLFGLSLLQEDVVMPSPDAPDVWARYIARFKLVSAEHMKLEPVGGIDVFPVDAKGKLG